VTETSAFEVELAIGKLKSHKSPGTEYIPVKLIKAGGLTIRSVSHQLMNSICNKVELPEKWKESITIPIYKTADKTDCSNYRHITFVNYIQNFIRHLAVKGNYWGSSVRLSTQQVNY
jgi:hypothetical protein